MIDDIRVGDIKLEKYLYRLSSSILADVTEAKEVHVPLWPNDIQEVLPLILKQDTVKVYVLQLNFIYGSRGDSGTPTLDFVDSGEATERFSDVIDKPFAIGIRINGTYRRYRINFQEPQPAIGYKFDVGVEPPDT